MWGFIPKRRWTPDSSPRPQLQNDNQHMPHLDYRVEFPFWGYLTSRLRFKANFPVFLAFLVRLHFLRAEL